MDEKRWQRIKTLFEVMRDRPPEERRALLDEGCADDIRLRQEVEALLTADEAAGPLDTPAAIGELASLAMDDSGINERVGPYRLVQEMGRGGMGTVYRAEREDGTFRQTVALKVIRGGFDSEELLSRFRYERQILAALDHPHIARLYDGGKTADGRPYLVMECVEGTPITEYCEAKNSSIEQRLALFGTVCRAVQHAHRNLIVHRDLKPSNILVTESGEVKLLDFGIAKLLHEDALDQTAPRTQTGLRLMTLEYAAPEQIKGEAITTATDVYQLGVLLYELLTGDRPFRSEGRPRREVERMILEEIPTRPSTAAGMAADQRHTGESDRGRPEESIAAEARRRRRRLAGDLDTIIMMALKKEPERRYASVELMAEDLRRHQVGLPVLARPDTFAYRASKFVRRHRVEVGALIGVALLVAGLVFYYTARLTEERNRARAEAVKAALINEFMQEMLASADPNRTGRSVTVAEVLDEAAGRLDTKLGDQPDIKASLHSTLGTTYRNLGLLEDAEPHARAALALRKQRASESPGQVVQSQVQLARVLYEKGAYDEAELELRDGINRLRALPHVDSLQMAEVFDALGVVLNETNRDEQAERYYREALSIYRRQEVSDARVGRVLNNLGIVLGNRGAFAKAEPLHREAVTIMQSAFGDEHPEVLYTKNNLAGVLDAQGRYQEAETLYRGVLTSRRKVLGAEHPWTILTMTSLANLLWLKKDYPAAVAAAREALTLGEKALPDGHPLTAYANLVLGQSLCDGDHEADGEPHLRAALAMRKAALPSGHWLIANTQSVLGGCLAAQQRFEEAEPLLLESYQKLHSDRGPQHEKTRDAARRLVHLYEAWGRQDDAARYRANQGSGE